VFTLSVNILTGKIMSGTMSDMKKVNAREFQKAFSKVTGQLAQGETVEITRRGKSFGFFTKAPGRAAVKMPDFAAALSGAPFIGAAGERLMAETLDEAVS
jgi:hypothetical protein